MDFKTLAVRALIAASVVGSALFLTPREAVGRGPSPTHIFAASQDKKGCHVIRPSVTLGKNPTFQASQFSDSTDRTTVTAVIYVIDVSVPSSPTILLSQSVSTPVAYGAPRPWTANLGPIGSSKMLPDLVLTVDCK